MALQNVRTLDNGTTVVELHGRLSVGKGLADTETELQNLIKGGCAKLIVDLASLDYIDSASLGMLTACRNQIDAQGGHMRLSRAHGTIARVFKVVHMDKIIPCDETLEASEAALA